MNLICSSTLAILISGVHAFVNVGRSPSLVSLQNDRLFVLLETNRGVITNVTLDGANLLGQPTAPHNAIGPYLDTYGIRGNFAPGSQANYSTFQGVDTTGVAYVGMVMSEAISEAKAGAVGETMEQYWFLRDGETGLHMFTRVAYHNPGVPFLGGLFELRTLFRPQSQIWTHLSSNDELYVPSPMPNPASTGSGISTLVQDTTWDLEGRVGDPYVDQVSRYFTKYTLSDSFRDHNLHGLFADGSQTPNNDTFGAWTIMNTKETYFGGPTHSDLVVDGILYNYMVSGHHGNLGPNLTTGFDRTFGPSVCYFNHGKRGDSLETLRADAAQYATSTYATEFYDSIASHVPNYVTTKKRGTLKAVINLPLGAIKPLAILTVSGIDYQDNAQVPSAYQYWSDISTDGCVLLDRIVPGVYRLTIYAEGIFGDYIMDNVIIEEGKLTTKNIEWNPETNGIELWRIGTPDKSSGEFRSGNQPDLTHPLHLPQYRIYWAQASSDFLTNFPHGVNFTVGQDDVSTALNVVHWSTYGGSGNTVRPIYETGTGNINNWTINFDTKACDLLLATEATLTIQLAGAKTSSGNTHKLNHTRLWQDIPYNVLINGHPLPTWTIPYYRSGSCIVRSAVQCYQNTHQWTFPTSYLKPDQLNQMVLSLPFNATETESAVLEGSVYVQYDALRLEVK